MQINGHLWKLLTIPSRRNWPVLGTLVDALRMVSLSAIPLPLMRRIDRYLADSGLEARQAMAVVRRPE